MAMPPMLKGARLGRIDLVADSRASELASGAGTERRTQVDLSFYRRYGKRALDVVLGSVLFIGLMPVMALAAIAVLVTSGWPVFYRAQRLGRYGRPLRMLKFRTMIRNADEALPQLLDSDKTLAAEYRNNLKLSNDPRTTRLGAVLRKLSIDELPQLWHVITGQMSLVGPRPYAANEIGLVSPHPEILEGTPGLTGPWQVGGRNQLPPNVRIAMESDYAQNVRLLSDLNHLVATVKCLLRPDGL